MTAPQTAAHGLAGPRPPVLSIAGSDPSGGAGIQADLKAISANGGYAMAVLTALTVQNTVGVRDIHLVPPDFVSAQIAAVVDDVPPAAIKIGMIATAAIAHAVADGLEAARSRLPDLRIVLDPVMVAKSGHRLLDADAVAVMRERLLPLADVITPNLPEAADLAGQPKPADAVGMGALAAALMALGARAVLLKGGHLAGPLSPDLLLLAEGRQVTLPGARIETRNTHGTGCTLAAALATRFAITGDLPRAAAEAKAYLSRAIAGADRLRLGQGHGPVDHFFMLPDGTSPLDQGRGGDGSAGP